MTTALTTRTWTLVHDDSAPALRAALQAATAQQYPLARAPVPEAGERCLLVVDWRRSPEALAWQSKARAAGASVLLLGLEPGSVSLGPWIAPDAGTAPCLGCVMRWSALNLGQKQHWSAQQEPLVSLDRASQAPLSPAGHQAFSRLLEQGLADPERLQGRMLRLNWERLSTDSHRLHRHPHCPDCPRLPPDHAELARLSLQARPLPPGGRARVANPKLSVSSLRENFLDHRTGVIKHLFHDLNSELMPMAVAEVSLPGEAMAESGFGRTESREGSELVAMLEALERFCGHQPRRHGASVRGSFEALRRQYGAAVMDPREFVLHGPEEMAQPTFELEPYSDALSFNWSWGWSFRRSEPVLVPQQMVYYRLGDEPGRPLNRFVYETSSGCALGGCLEEATLYGLMEMLERDAYLTSWYGRIPPRELDLDQVQDERVRALVARSRAQGYQVHAFDMRLDIDVPLVWALIVDPRDDAPVKSYCASAGHVHWEQALFAALVEVTTSMGVYQVSMPPLRERALAMAADPWKVRRMDDHVLLYSLPEVWPRLSFLFDGAPPQPLPAPAPAPTDLRDELMHRVQQTLAVASDVIVVNQSWGPMEALNLHCVKVLAPGLTPVTFGHQHRRCALSRLNAARQARGLPVMTQAEINPEPHNFP